MENELLDNVVVNGDAKEVLKGLGSETIHLTFTSPPYFNAREYSQYITYDEYLQQMIEIFNEVHRVTKEGRFLVVNSSPIIMQRENRRDKGVRYPIPFDLNRLLCKNGWTFIDDIIWLKPEGSAINRNANFYQIRKPLTYKPNVVTEYLMVYRKTTDKLLDFNLKQYSDDVVKNSLVADGYERSNVWKINPCFDKVHNAVFPKELCMRVIEYYSYRGDLVLDPFAGSGTCGSTARLLGRSFFMIEKKIKHILTT